MHVDMIGFGIGDCNSYG